MIIIDDDLYYMTLGEACYTVRARDGKLCGECFGKRIEREDDARLLGGAACAGFYEIEKDDIVIRRGGKTLNTEFTLVEVTTEDKSTMPCLPSLRGGNTLKAVAEDKANGLVLTLYYTPYSRGGIARRAVLKNVSDKPVEIDRLMSGGAATGGGDVNVTDDGLVTVETESGTYGFFAMYAGERINEVANGGKRVAVGAALGVTLRTGESFYTPEMLAVYSDNGVGGVMRIYHDIIREFGMPEGYSDLRRPILLYMSSSGGKEEITRRAAVAAETGADTVASYVSGSKVSELTAFSAAVRSHGMKFGLRVAAKDTGADLPSILAKTQAEYVEFDCSEIKTYADACKFYALYRETADCGKNIIIDFIRLHDCSSAAAALERSARSPIPLASARSVVKSGTLSPKTAFDITTLGALGYEIDSSDMPTGARLAIRAQILSYQDDADLVKNGDLYKIPGGIMTVSKDKAKAYAVVVGDAKFVGLDEHGLYHVRETGRTFSGAALAYYGIPAETDGETVTYHLRQVADYE